MTDFEESLLRAVADLPTDRRASLLAYIRLLKIDLVEDDEAMKERFEKTWKRVRIRAKKLNITRADIDAEIRAVRKGK